MYGIPDMEISCCLFFLCFFCLNCKFIVGVSKAAAQFFALFFHLLADAALLAPFVVLSNRLIRIILCFLQKITRALICLAQDFILGVVDSCIFLFMLLF